MFTQNELHLLFDWIDIDKIDDERRQYALVAKILDLMD